MQEINLNTLVKIRLTERGNQLKRDRWNRIRRDFPSIGVYSAPSIDEDGFVTMMLWEVMNEFGQYFYNGASDPPTELRFFIIPDWHYPPKSSPADFGLNDDGSFIDPIH